jgi:hypothetical protein
METPEISKGFEEIRRLCIETLTLFRKQTGYSRKRTESWKSGSGKPTLKSAPRPESVADFRPDQHLSATGF